MGATGVIVLAYTADSNVTSFKGAWTWCKPQFQEENVRSLHRHPRHPVFLSSTHHQVMAEVVQHGAHKEWSSCPLCHLPIRTNFSHKSGHSRTLSTSGTELFRFMTADFSFPLWQKLTLIRLIYSTPPVPRHLQMFKLFQKGRRIQRSTPTSADQSR